MAAIIPDFVSYNARVQHDFSPLLLRGLTISQRSLLGRVAEEAQRRGLPLYAVGGLPRDLWLGNPVTDVDLVVEGDAIGLARALAGKYGGTVTTHTRFGTAKWDLRGTALESSGDGSMQFGNGRAGRHLDLISARSETYRHPGALPTVKPGSIEDDIRRRDFTINTLAVRLDGAHFGETQDEFGGLQDLKMNLIRVLHAGSFLDDPTRMYRGVRYEQRFEFRLAHETLALIPEARKLVAHLSGQRIRHELDLILDEPNGAPMLGRLAKLDLLRPIHADLPTDRAALRRVELADQLPPTQIPSWSRRHAAWMLWLIDLEEVQIRSVARHLRMPNVAQRDMLGASRLNSAQAGLGRWKPSRCAAYLEAYPDLAIFVVHLASSGKPKRVLKEYLTTWKRVKPTTTGHDLKRRGLPPGPAYRRILRALREARLDGRVHNQAQEERLLLELMHRESQATPGARTHASGSKGTSRGTAPKR